MENTPKRTLQIPVSRPGLPVPPALRHLQLRLQGPATPARTAGRLACLWFWRLEFPTGEATAPHLLETDRVTGPSKGPEKACS